LKLVILSLQCFTKGSAEWKLAIKDLNVVYPDAHRGTVVLWGLLAAYPFGGMTWQVLQYLVGIRQCGFDVWYVEDTDTNGLHPETLEWSDDIESKSRYLRSQLEPLGLQDRWVLRVPCKEGVTVGCLDWRGLLRLYSAADTVINLCGSHELRSYHDSIRHKIYLETDPVLNQVMLAQGNSDTRQELDQYQSLVTYAENLGKSDCKIPTDEREWIRTRPPVVSQWWQKPKLALPVSSSERFTTITNWKFSSNDIEYGGEIWRWSKHHEFIRFQQAPAYAKQSLELAVAGLDKKSTHSGMPVDQQTAFRAKGWHLSDANRLSAPTNYRDYILSSSGEFTVAKEQYVKPVSGWSSDRSVCYLAASRPVVTQETGFSKYIPCGSGLFSFDTLEDIGHSFETIRTNPEKHRQAARDIACEYFEAEHVVRDMLMQAGLF